MFKRVIAHSGVYLGSEFATRAIGFLLIPLYTHLLSPADYGILAVVTAVSSVLGALFNLGLAGSLSRFYYEWQQGDRRRNTWTLWVLTGLAGLLVTVVLDRLGTSISRQLSSDIPFDPYLRIGIWSAWFFSLGILPLVALRIQQRPIAYGICSVIEAALGGLLAVFLILVQRQGVLGALRAQFVTGVFLVGVYGWFLKEYIGWRLNLRVIRPALVFGLPLVPHRLAGWALNLSDRLILQAYVSLSDIGVYSLAYMLGSAISIVGLSVNTAWTPLFFEAASERVSPNRLDRLISRYTTYFLASMGMISMLLVLFAPEIIAILSSPQYELSASIVPIIAVAFFFHSVYIMFVNLLFLEKVTSRIPLITVPAALFNIGLNVLFVPRYGIWAAAYATLACYSLMAVLSIVLAWHFHQIRYETGRLIKLLIGYVIVSLIGFQMDFDSIVVTVFGKLGLVLFLGVVLYFRGFLDQRELDAISHLLIVGKTRFLRITREHFQR